MKKIGKSQKEIWIQNEKQQLYDLNTFNEVKYELNLDEYMDEDDLLQIRRVLAIIEYPSSRKAEIHRMAHRLGSIDIGEYKQIDGKRQFQRKKNQNQPVQVRRCECCDYQVRDNIVDEFLPFLSRIGNLGVTTHLYFRKFDQISVILLEMLIVYSLFSIVTNVISSIKFNGCVQTDDFKCTTTTPIYIFASLGSKMMNATAENDNYYLAQCCLGVVLVVFWIFTFVWQRKKQRQQQVLIDDQQITVSDFTVAIEGLPEETTKQSLQQQLDQYGNKIKQYLNVLQSKIVPLNIVKFNKANDFHGEVVQTSKLQMFMNIFNKYILQKKQQVQLSGDKLDRLNEIKANLKKQFVFWITQRYHRPQYERNKYGFNQAKQKRELYFRKYREITHLIDKEKKRLEQIRLLKKPLQLHPIFFVTFDSSKAKDLLCELNPPQWGLQLLNYIQCKGQYNNFKYKSHWNTPRERTFSLDIQRAAQPEDIIWGNVGLTKVQYLGRKIKIFVLIGLQLGASFVFIYLLTKKQQEQRKSGSQNNYFSIFISLVLSVINVIIKQSITLLSNFERQYTTIKYQTTLATKVIVASILNTIFVPLAVSYFIKKNIYEKDGLADDVFMFAITNSLVQPIKDFFNFGFWFKKIKEYFMSNLIKKKLAMSQKQYNEEMMNIEFNFGAEYVYIVNTYLYVCFFAALQPIICLFAFVGFLLMHSAKKCRLFWITRRPIAGSEIMNYSMSQFIYLGPLFFSIGHFTWSNIKNNGVIENTVIPNGIAVALSVIFLVFPMNMVMTWNQQRKVRKGQKKKSELLFDQYRKDFPSEYDRLNPATIEEGFQCFVKYLEEYKENNKNKKEQKQRQKFIQKMNQRIEVAKRIKKPQIVTRRAKNKSIQKNIQNKEQTKQNKFKQMEQQTMNFKQDQKSYLSILNSGNKLRQSSRILMKPQKVKQQNYGENQPTSQQELTSGLNSGFKKQQKDKNSLSKKPIKK